ncbi:T-complex protein 11-domain-containing protein [Fimicolochytrium jonesii]|uniref:T-complex protein 11-domain-containing protein n=1 Tax=Fimicolochytrium jonesii TaxID=1396493 RepID=UPI0022FF0C14|nr:T-complex protein 11-domain-containing protein [Fimicolochytrium jonesii]KAI8815885.1 T-complex protein 11-domain-containing protein [Fimicolochytrium jonesii]
MTSNPATVPTPHAADLPVSPSTSAGNGVSQVSTPNAASPATTAQQQQQQGGVQQQQPQTPQQPHYGVGGSLALGSAAVAGSRLKRQSVGANSPTGVQAAPFAAGRLAIETAFSRPASHLHPNQAAGTSARSGTGPAPTSAAMSAVAAAAAIVANATPLRKSRSMSFYVDLTSPISPISSSSSSSTARSTSSGRPLDLSDDTAQQEAPSKKARLQIPSPHPSSNNTTALPSPKNSSRPPDFIFPPFTRDRGTSAEIYTRMTHRLLRAQSIRDHAIHDRRARLRRRFEQIRYRILLQKQRERLTSLKIQAKSEYAISAANLKRQLILKRNMDRCGAAVERAQTVAMAHKLRKFMELRRSFSENFAELLASAGDSSDVVGTLTLTGTGADVLRAMDAYRTTLSLADAEMGALGLRDFPMDAGEEYDAETPMVGPRMSPGGGGSAFSHTSPAGHHVDLAALRGGISANDGGSGGNASANADQADGHGRAAPASSSSLSRGPPSGGVHNAPSSSSGTAPAADHPGGASSNNGTNGVRPSNRGDRGVDTSLLSTTTNTNTSSLLGSAGTSTPSPTTDPSITAATAAAADLLLSSTQDFPSPTHPTPPSTGESLSATILRLRILPISILEEMEETDYLQLLPLLPPITRFTLRELELTEILSNAQLRHDLFFDPELQFKPNLDGEQGAEKREAGDAYWTDVEVEVAEGHTFRLPLLLYEIRCILVELLPYTQERREELDRNLDVALIAQQIEHGVLNPVGLVGYLAGLLKANCAPARDELVDQMVEWCKGGDIVRTLRTCFEVLELMKLDYANHQLQRVRPYVVEHATEFEWRWFKDQYEAEAIKLDDTILWLQQALEKWFPDSLPNSPSPTTTTTTPVKAQQPPPAVQQLHLKSLLHLISQSHLLSQHPTTIPLPETLRMDVSRLVQYYNDWQDITIMAALLVLFRQACAGAPRPPSQNQLEELKRTLWVLLNDHETTMVHVTLQMCRAAGVVRGREFGEREVGMMERLVESTLQPESRLYEIIRGRVGGVVERWVAGDATIVGGGNTVAASPASTTSTTSTDSVTSPDQRPVKPIPAASTIKPAPTTTTTTTTSTTPRMSHPELAKIGLLELEDELIELAERCRRLVQHNWTVFANLYVGVVGGLCDPAVVYAVGDGEEEVKAA